jgi:hypothetical protein
MKDWRRFRHRVMLRRSARACLIDCMLFRTPRYIHAQGFDDFFIHRADVGPRDNNSESRRACDFSAMMSSTPTGRLLRIDAMPAMPTTID